MPPKRRRRFQGLYYHSSPPKVLPMNGQIANSNGRRERGSDDLSVKLSTIRIWMHEKDIGKLTRVLWAGQGNRLRQQASTNAKVKRFLAAVPYVMNSIKDVHHSVIDNNLENLQANLEPPVPPSLVTCRDANGLNLIHKAAGLGHATILEYLITTWPDGVHETDITGKTPLHWAASAKNNMRCYTLLTQAGCDDEAVDYKMKTPSFYRHKPHEIERAFLTYVPEAPRVSPDVNTDWEALSDESGAGKKLDIKIPEMNGYGMHSNAESNENTSEAEMTETASGHEDEDAREEYREPPVLEQQIEENAAEEEAETKNDETNESEEIEIQNEVEEDKQEQESETTNEEAEMPDGKEEEEKPQTQTATEAALNLAKDSTEEENIESIEVENGTDNDKIDELHEPSTVIALDEQQDNEDKQDNENDVEQTKPITPIDEKGNEESTEIMKDEEKNTEALIENEVNKNQDEDPDGTEQTENELQIQDAKNEGDEEDDSKTLENTLVDINNEENDIVESLEDKENNDLSGEDGDTNNEIEQIDKSSDDKKELNETEDSTGNEMQNSEDPSIVEETDTQTIQTEVNNEISANSSQLNNSSNENFPFHTQTPHPAAPRTPTKESIKEENEKTEEDENNNNNNKLTTEETINKNKTEPTETITQEQFQELNEALEKFEKSGENFLHEEDNDNGKNEDTSKDSETDKVAHGRSTNNDSEQLDTESNDVVLHTESIAQQKSANTYLKDGESSDDTGDEDEDQEIEAETEENNGIAEENYKTTQAGKTEQKQEQEQDPLPLETDNETNEDKLKDVERNDEDSITSSLAIEGFVQGDAEDNTVQSQTAANVDDDDDEETRLQNIIASGDMEQLAQFVLNGDGEKLMNVQATKPEIQAFLKNVPNYMSKIRDVHEAARNGSLLNLQQALDRRKFAVAKDAISPNGATPLHVAVLFGNSDIVRYLSARFPETTTITDNDERTALHYAAVINDNGHFYNVLSQLGANPKVIDNLGHTPEEYLGKEELSKVLSYGQLLKRFGAEHLEEQLLSDQGRIENQSFQENPIFKTEQVKYLSDNLADPLVKALKHVEQKRPNDPLQYFANYFQSYVTSLGTNGRTLTQVAVHSGSSQTDSTVLASPNQRVPAPVVQMQRQTSQMNGHADNIEEYGLPQIETFDDADDGNDSDAIISKKMEERDEHGQSMLHFACARSHRKGGLIHLIEDAKADVTYRDELYRTARDVALQANQLGNAKEIDRYVMSLAIVGDVKPFEHFALSGYDHIIDIVDDNDTPIVEVVEARGLTDLAEFLKTIRPLEELREELHQMIRDNNVGRVMEIADGSSGKWLIKARNYYGRTALHIAILYESVEFVEHFVNLCPEALKIGDNLERTPLHYAMGTNIIESISRILIQNGAKRTSKDLKGRQPSYYFMNKADVLRLQEEEDESR